MVVISKYKLRPECTIVVILFACSLTAIPLAIKIFHPGMLRDGLGHRKTFLIGDENILVIHKTNIGVDVISLLRLDFEPKHVDEPHPSIVTTAFKSATQSGHFLGRSVVHLRFGWPVRWLYITSSDRLLRELYQERNINKLKHVQFHVKTNWNVLLCTVLCWAMCIVVIERCVKFLLRHTRFKRGLCRYCAYPMHNKNFCNECGASLL